MINNNEWYKNRILWKANKNELFNNNCVEFKDLSIKQKQFIIDLIPENKIPVIIFFSGINKWTLLCTDILFSYHEGELVNIAKNKMCQKFIPTIKKTNNRIISNQQKKEVRWLYAVENKKFIWFPSANELWNFWGILQMLCKLK